MSKDEGGTWRRYVGYDSSNSELLLPMVQLVIILALSIALIAVFGGWRRDRSLLFELRKGSPDGDPAAVEKANEDLKASQADLPRRWQYLAEALEQGCYCCSRRSRTFPTRLSYVPSRTLPFRRNATQNVPCFSASQGRASSITFSGRFRIEQKRMKSCSRLSLIVSCARPRLFAMPRIHWA